MATYDFQWRLGDTLPDIKCQLRDQDGPLANMDTSTVKIKIRKWRTLLPLVVDQAAVIYNTTLAYVSYDWINGAPAEEGQYEIVWEVTKAGGDIITVPNTTPLTFRVWPNI